MEHQKAEKVKIAQTTEKKPKGAAKQGRGTDRLIDILKYLHHTGRPERPNDIAAGIGAPKSTIYEITNRLLEENFLEKFDSEGRLFLGRKLHFFGNSYLEKFNLVKLARPLIRTLGKETGETAQLCMIDDKKYVVALSHEGAQHFKIITDVGHPIPLTWTASGRVLVAGMTDEEILELIPPEDFVLPNGADLPVEKFLSEVAQAKLERIYVSNSSIDRFTYCYAAAVTDQTGACLATMCLVTPRGDKKKRRMELQKTLIRFADNLSRELGA